MRSIRGLGRCHRGIDNSCALRLVLASHIRQTTLLGSETSRAKVVQICRGAEIGIRVICMVANTEGYIVQEALGQGH